MRQPASERLNIHLDPGLKERIRIGSARAGQTLSQYCEEAIRRRLSEDGLLPADRRTARESARSLDRLRRAVGPLGVPVRDLIAEGRRD